MTNRRLAAIHADLAKLRWRPVRKLKPRLSKPARWKPELETLAAMERELVASARHARAHSPTAGRMYTGRLKAVRLAIRVLTNLARKPGKTKLLPVVPVKEGAGPMPVDTVDDLWRSDKC